MYRLILFLVAAMGWADEGTLALMIRAQSDFDRVELSPFPRLQDTMRCAQSQAEILPVMRPSEQPGIYYRKGYCELLNGNNRAAAGDFGRALAAWTTRAPEPVSAGLQVLSAVARLRAGADPGEMAGIRAGLEEAQNNSICQATVMPVNRCREFVELGRLWLGWLAAREGRGSEAARHFGVFPQTAWPSWVAAREALDRRKYDEAAGLLRKAVQAWQDEERYPKPGVLRLLGPPGELAQAMFLLGKTEYLAAQYKSALASLEAALKADPANAEALFLRGRARDALGETEAALNDYQLAGRLAFAHPERPNATALAHYFRGVWLYRRNLFSQAEDEFTAALNNTGDPGLRTDVGAWRDLAATAGGACESSALKLESALQSASDLFPKPEARQRLRACRPSV